MTVKNILLTALGMVLTMAINAQDIQLLPADPSIKSGTLPNGMSYYVAENPALKGIADFALVQRVGTSSSDSLGREEVIFQSRSSLSSLRRLLSPSVQDYFMSQGAVPSNAGFVELKDNATVFSFRNIPVSSLDSTLMVLTGMVERFAFEDDALLRSLYSPSDHAVIVAGDVKAADVKTKLGLLSMMVPSSEPMPRKVYEWRPHEGVDVEIYDGNIPGLARVKVLWRLQRTPVEFMNTVQPAIYERYLNELGIVAASRIKKDLRAGNVAYADVSYDYIDSVESLDDESFEISVTVRQSDVEKVVEVLGRVMAQMDSSDADASEVVEARAEYMEDLFDKGAKVTANSSYIDRCVAAFIYNSPLSSESEVYEFHSSRSVEAEKELNLFNSIVSSTLDAEAGLILEYKGAEGVISEERLKELFAASWASVKPSPKPESVPQTPTLGGMSEKIKVKSSRKEHLSGGTIWTLSNGMRVIFKKMPTDNMVYYSLALNGGYGNVTDLCRGEGGYFSDILYFSRIGGVDGSRFIADAREHGMTMDFNVGLSTTILEGRIPDDGLEYMMRALLAFFNDRSMDADAMRYFLECESLRLDKDSDGIQARKARMEEVMCPDYEYTSFKSRVSDADALLAKMEKFMADQAAKMNDGMLVLVGDIDEKLLKDVLVSYAGGFNTVERAFARPVVRSRYISGTVRYVDQAPSAGADIKMSVPMALTAGNYYTAELASMVLRDKLASTIAHTGMWLELEHNCRKYPQERFNLTISLNEARVEGFAPGSVHINPEKALKVVKEMLEDPESMVVTDAEMASYKAILKKFVNDRKKDPQYWPHAISLRYLDGKDFMTGSDKWIDAVTVEKVKELLSSLSGGSGVEYIINKE